MGRHARARFTREHEESGGVRAIGDPLLRSADTTILDLRAQRRGIGACLRFGQGERSQLVACGERRDEALDLLRRPVERDRERGGASVHRHGHAQSGVPPREFLDHEYIGEKVGPGPAMLGGHAHAHQAELAELTQQLAREVVLAIPGGRAWNNAVVDEATCHVANVPLLVAELVRAHACHASIRAAKLFKNVAASAPSSARWSQDMQRYIIERMAIESLPSSSVITTGRLTIASVSRIATCGWLITGVAMIEP